MEAGLSMSENERIAILEQRINDADAWRDEYGQKIDRLLELSAKQRGFVAGAAFAISALGFLISQMFHKLTQ